MFNGEFHTVALDGNVDLFLYLGEWIAQQNMMQ